jgi:hypothetical protein
MQRTAIAENTGLRRQQTAEEHVIDIPRDALL